MVNKEIVYRMLDSNGNKGKLRKSNEYTVF